MVISVTIFNSKNHVSFTFNIPNGYHVLKVIKGSFKLRFTIVSKIHINFEHPCSLQYSTNTCHSAPQSKNAVSTFQIICRVLSFVLENSWSDEQMITTESHHILYYLSLRTEVIMQSNYLIYIFIVTLECTLSNENKIPVNKATLFKYNQKQCVCKIEQYVMCSFYSSTVCDATGVIKCTDTFKVESNYTYLSINFSHHCNNYIMCYQYNAIDTIRMFLSNQM